MLYNSLLESPYFINIPEEEHGDCHLAHPTFEGVGGGLTKIYTLGPSGLGMPLNSFIWCCCVYRPETNTGIAYVKDFN